MSALRVIFFVALAIACVFAAEERVKKQVLLGASPYAYSGYAAPLAYSAGYSAGYAAPLAYSAPAALPAYGYSGYSGLYSNGLYY
ncbi:hypothetical protein GE061_017804 [Apolygus lucorum]|uniref:Uncharacterized protein n=1 Tax=Apolygus lucorum TaxID=248454 RepID=A0A8S9XBX9_APOLU|nr:hypothetical protein GE061_017802 [Apolygus lucorum]KAF6206569.1 hypothetical protein GE061_017803 [Apolygus lucorum]KAF6206570.1 hypothetical protein GE061_017804 [Apolygus lucorum]